MRGYTERMEWLNKFKDEDEEVTHEEIMNSYFDEDDDSDYVVPKFYVKIFFKHPEDWTEPAPFFLTNEDGRVEFDEFEDAEVKAQEIAASNGSVTTMVVRNG